jgi:probable HAF family extracellular repeat protein
MKPDRRLPRILAIYITSLAAVLLIASIPAGAVKYYYQDLGISAENMSATGINDLGYVVGDGYLWSQTSGFQDLGASRMAMAINNSTWVVGLPGAWLYTPSNGIKDLGTLADAGVSDGEARGINNNGNVVGTSPTTTNHYGPWHAFSWTSSDGMKDLGTLGGPFSRAWAINDKENIVGHSWTTEGGINHAFLWTPADGMKDLNSLVTNLSSGAVIVDAKSINNNGDIVGYYNYALFPGGSSTYLISQKNGFTIQPLWPNGTANCINNYSQVVGTRLDGDKTYAVIWDQKSGVQNLNNLTVNLPTGITLCEATAINNLGQIVGYAYSTDTGNTSAFLLTPKVEVANKIYGVFIGSEIDTPEKPHDFRADKAAELMAQKFTMLPGYAETRLLTKKMVDGGNKKSEVQAAIDYFKTKMKPGDGLVFYVHCHGAPIGFDLFPIGYALGIGSESIESIFHWNTVDNSPNDFLTDTDLHNMLDGDLPNIVNGMDKIQKWVFIDACHSGGFYNSIHTLKNACMVASAEADKDAHYSSLEGSSREGRGLFSYALDEGFNREANGKLKVDSNQNGFVSFDEILKYIYEYMAYMARNESWPWRNDKIVCELNFGDPAIFTLDMWNPTGFRTADFVGGFSTNRKDISPFLFLLLD